VKELKVVEDDYADLIKSLDEEDDAITSAIEKFNTTKVASDKVAADKAAADKVAADKVAADKSPQKYNEADKSNQLASMQKKPAPAGVEEKAQASAPAIDTNAIVNAIQQGFSNITVDNMTVINFDK
jgi:hypothetical protein